MDQAAGKPLVPFKVFLSYSHQDRRFRNKLADHLAQLLGEGWIEVWYDDQIVPGSNFNDAIRDKLDQSDLVLFLVSAAFLASDYIRDFELVRAYELEGQGRLLILPILLKSVENWRKHRLFASRQGPLSGDLAITSRRDREMAFSKVAEGVRRAVEDLHRRRSASLVGSPGPVPVPAVAAGLARVVDGRPLPKIEESLRLAEVDPAASEGVSQVRAFLWLPNRQTLREKLPDYFVAGVVCDVRLFVAEAPLARLPDDLDRLEPYYASSLANLKPEIREEIIGLVRQAMTGQSVGVLAIPRTLVGDTLIDLDFVYELLLNRVVSPLATAHARPRVSRFELILNPIDDAASGKKPLEGYAKKLLKARFAAGRYRVAQRSPGGRGDLFLFLARFLQWAGSRSYNEGNPDWLGKLEDNFEKLEGLPGGSPSS